MRRLVAILAVLLLLGGCGVDMDLRFPGDPPTEVDGATPDPTALAAWDRFPADARPRPLVLEGLPGVPAKSGDDAVDAAISARRFRLAAALPPDPPATVAVTLPDGPATLPSLGAGQAFALLATGGGAGPVATVTAVRLAPVAFGTDRGASTLPAWLFTVQGADRPVAWPALAASAYWGTPWPMQSGGVPVSADGRTLTVRLIESPQGPGCPGAVSYHYAATALESPHAVVVGLRVVTDGVVPGEKIAACGGGASPAVWRGQMYQVHLAQPLGGRVVMQVDGAGPPPIMRVVPGGAG